MAAIHGASGQGEHKILEMFDIIAETRFDVIRDQLIAQNIRTMLASVEQQSERSI